MPSGRLVPCPYRLSVVAKRSFLRLHLPKWHCLQGATVFVVWVVPLAESPISTNAPCTKASLRWVTTPFNPPDLMVCTLIWMEEEGARGKQ